MSEAGSKDASTSSRLKRAVSSKLSSYLPSRSAHLNAYSIELDEPHRKYGPGDTVRGSVVLNVGRPLGVTHIVVCLYGYVEVFKNHQKTSRVHKRNNFGRSPTGNSKRWVAEYYGDGFASLFEEEIVLCGEGRLDPKLYHFRFEIDFPVDMDLPTSIDFERGTINYILTSTITRPSSIAAPTTCEVMLGYRDSIIVGNTHPPKPQEVTLRAVEKPSRPKVPALKRLTSSDKQREPRNSTLSRTTLSIRSSGSREQSEVSRHASMSVPSSRSSSSSRRPPPSIASDLISTQYSKTSRTEREPSNKNITASVQLATGGCLAGEVVQLTINVSHTKAVKSLHGVIVTLYRQARVDMHPNLPVTLADKKEQYEDYYPRSKTGLGGLSLSAAGSSQVWRKDLSQTFAPLYVDPMTMTAEVKAAVRVPDDVFPTIRNVPGDMISFRYFIEVVIDIHGKLNSSEWSRSLNLSAPQSAFPASPGADGLEARDPILTAWGTNCVDTAPMRRHKDAIALHCDLLVGTRHSLKALGKRRASASDTQSSITAPAPFEALPGRDNTSAEQFSPMDDTFKTDLQGREDYPTEEGYWGYDGHWYSHDEGYGPQEEQEQYGHAYQHGWEQGYALAFGQVHGISGYGPPHGYGGPPVSHNGAPLPQFYPAVPPPPNTQDAGLSEKEQMRRAEAALLPSAPPMTGEGSINVDDGAPSAPLIPEEAHLHQPRISRTTNHLTEDFANATPRPGDGFNHLSSPPNSTLPSEITLDRHHTPRVARDSTSQQDPRPSAPTFSPEDEALFQGTRRLHIDDDDTRTVRASGTGEYLPRYER